MLSIPDMVGLSQESPMGNSIFIYELCWLKKTKTNTNEHVFNKQNSF